MKKLKLIVVIILTICAVSALLYFQFGINKAGNSPSDELLGWKFPVAKFPLTGVDGNLAYSDIRDPGGIPKGLPVRLKIPSLGVDTAIEDAYISNDGRMDVPAGSVNVAWFALGPHPGKIGSAVIGGHFGIDNGVPKVFYNLNKIKIGDKVYIENDKGDTLAFMVRFMKSFDRNADATEVFTSNDGLAHLNIITCEGLWNQVNDSYPDRFVVFTDAIASEGEVVVIKKEPQKVAKLPETAITPAPSVEPQAIATPAINLYSVKNLYKTPTDGLVTSFLLISIVFITLKIFKKKNN